MKSATVGAEDIDIDAGIFGFEDDAMGPSPIHQYRSENEWKKLGEVGTDLIQINPQTPSPSPSALRKQEPSPDPHHHYRYPPVQEGQVD